MGSVSGSDAVPIIMDDNFNLILYYVIIWCMTYELKNITEEQFFKIHYFSVGKITIS